MPKLDGGNFGTKFGYQIDKFTDTVGFEDSTHTYFDLEDGSKYISVTQLVHMYQPIFDSQFWASYKACEAILGDRFRPLKSQLLSNKVWKDDYLIDYSIDINLFKAEKEKVLQSYKDKAEEACSHGTNVHNMMENLFYQKDEARLKRFGLGGKIEVPKGYYKLDKEYAAYPEIMISYKADDYLKVVGTADLVIKDGNEITLYDYKTNKSIDKESYFDRASKKREMLKYPLNNIMSSNYWVYTLQLSLYMYMIEKMNPKFKCKKLALIHIDRNFNETEYECPYLKDDVIKMLLHYRKINKSKMELDKDKPIIF